MLSFEWPSIWRVLKLNATKKLRTQLLFPNSHPIVQDDLERLKKMGPRNAVEYDLDWSSEPEETCPKWLKQHWAMMQELEASVAKKKSLTLYLASIPLPWRYHLKICSPWTKAAEWFIPNESNMPWTSSIQLELLARTSSTQARAYIEWYQVLRIWCPA